MKLVKSNFQFLASEGEWVQICPLIHVALWILSHIQAVKVQTSLCNRIFSLETSMITHTVYGGTQRQRLKEQPNTYTIVTKFSCADNNVLKITLCMLNYINVY